MVDLSNRKRFPCLGSRGRIQDSYNGWEFFQPLECLYQDMQTQEKRFLLLSQKNFSEKKAELFVDGTNYSPAAGGST